MSNSILPRQSLFADGPTASRTVDLATPYGSFYGAVWQHGRHSYLAHVTYHIGDDLQIHRTIPLPTDEAGAQAWVDAQFVTGPLSVVAEIQTALEVQR